MVYQRNWHHHRASGRRPILGISGSVIGRNTVFGKERDPIVWEAGDRYPHSIMERGLLGDITCVAIATVLFKQWNMTCRKSLVFAAAKFMQAYRFEGFTAKHIIGGLAKTAGESEDAIENYLALVESVFECGKDAGRFELVKCLGEDAVANLVTWEEMITY